MWTSGDAVGWIHALVLGVSDYPQAGDAEVGAVAGPSISALRFAEWLEDGYRPPHGLPIETRVLLSPVAEEQPAVDASKVTVAGRADRDTVERELRAWADRCDESPNHVGVLFLAGHGTEAPVSGGHLLLEGFERGTGLDHALDLKFLFDAMEYRAAAVNFIFVDACRVGLREQTDFAGQVGMRPVKIEGYAVPRRDRLKVLFGAANGLKAWTLPEAELLQHGTVFGWALKRSLETAAEPDDDGNLVVNGNLLAATTANLAAAKLAEMNARYAEDIRGRVDGAGSLFDAAFHCPESVPVSIEIELTPDSVVASAAAKLYRFVNRKKADFDREVALDPHPARLTVPSGLYELGLCNKAPPPPEFDFRQEHLVIPGVQRWLVEVPHVG